MTENQELCGRNAIKFLLEYAIKLSENEVLSNTKTEAQHKFDTEDLHFYLTLLNNKGTLRLLPSKYAELCIGTLRLLLRR